MKTSTIEIKHGIQWTAGIQMDDLYFTDDMNILSHTQQQMQKKTTSVAAASPAKDLNIHKRKSKILRYNTTCNNRITLDREDLQDVEACTDHGSIIDEHVDGSDADVKALISKARTPHLQMKNIWDSKQLSTKTKVRIFNINVKTVLLDGVVTWRITKAIIQNIQVFINSCLHKILGIG
ncbi:unnamed protein product [Schistosoma margrebowiei]|uniref:Uncharacterized protein n=1 Tax=Schistosoma margrebowiei TaxID=48269 RepID=A0A183M113_9TREM|nr:unnamed protein product [Schistosoma margrebowiei]